MLDAASWVQSKPTWLALGGTSANWEPDKVKSSLCKVGGYVGWRCARNISKDESYAGIVRYLQEKGSSLVKVHKRDWGVIKVGKGE